ncbi:MAG: hypothetical protein ACI97P_001251 [Arcticibacterium sp.]
MTLSLHRAFNELTELIPVKLIIEDYPDKSELVEESRFQGVVLNVAMMKARLSGRGLTNANFQYLRHFL